MTAHGQIKSPVITAHGQHQQTPSLNDNNRQIQQQHTETQKPPLDQHLEQDNEQVFCFTPFDIRKLKQRRKSLKGKVLLVCYETYYNTSCHVLYIRTNSSVNIVLMLFNNDYLEVF